MRVFYMDPKHHSVLKKKAPKLYYNYHEKLIVFVWHENKYDMNVIPQN